MFPETPATPTLAMTVCFLSVYLVRYVLRQCLFRIPSLRAVGAAIQAGGVIRGGGFMRRFWIAALRLAMTVFLLQSEAQG
jgi:hypothetical protein